MSAKGHATLVTQLYFAPERGIPEDLVVKMARNDGALAASFDVALVKA